MMDSAQFPLARCQRSSDAERGRANSAWSRIGSFSFCALALMCDSESRLGEMNCELGNILGGSYP